MHASQPLYALVFENCEIIRQQFLYFPSQNYNASTTLKCFRNNNYLIILKCFSAMVFIIPRHDDN